MRLSSHVKGLLDPSELCPVCWGQLSDPELSALTLLDDCHHVFHSDCLADWIKGSRLRSRPQSQIRCPKCTHQLSPADTRRLGQGCVVVLGSAVCSIEHTITLRLSLTEFGCDVPPEVWELTGLRKLCLAKLCRLPTEIGRLAHLRTLMLPHNRLFDLPPALAQLSQLDLLDLSHNCLWSIGTTIPKLPVLRVLDLGHNRLCGLPRAVAALTRLQVLDLNHNKIQHVSGCVVELLSLVVLSLDGNPLLSSQSNTRLVTQLRSQSCAVEL